MTGSNATSTRILLASLTALVLALAGCASTDFDEGKARGIESAPVKIDAEQVTLGLDQVNCGVQNDLWDPPGTANQGRSVARLSAKGRALKFSDDVVVSDPAYTTPYVQVRGDFMVGVTSVSGARDGPEKDTKLADVRLGVKIDHACFPAPLPIMGLKKGDFSPDVAPVILFRNYDGWKFEKFVH
jgi:hypothetical protein